MDRLIIGEVLKPQGIRGELKIKTFTDEPTDVKAFGTVYIDNVAYKILSFRVGPDGAAYPTETRRNFSVVRSWKARAKTHPN